MIPPEVNFAQSSGHMATHLKLKCILAPSDYRLNPPRCPARWLIPELILRGQSHFNEPFPFQQTIQTSHLVQRCEPPLVVESQIASGRTCINSRRVCIYASDLLFCFFSVSFVCVVSMRGTASVWPRGSSTGSIIEEWGLAFRELCELKAFEILNFYIFFFLCICVILSTRHLKIWLHVTGEE